MKKTRQPQMSVTSAATHSGPAQLMTLYQALFRDPADLTPAREFQSAVTDYNSDPANPAYRGQLFHLLQRLNNGVDPGLSEDQILSFREMLSRDARYPQPRYHSTHRS